MATDHRTASTEDRRTRRTALSFVILIGILSFFADFTYEGSRSIIGPYLALFGASGTVVGVVTGLASCSAMASGWSRGGWLMPPAGSGR